MFFLFWLFVAQWWLLWQHLSASSYSPLVWVRSVCLVVVSALNAHSSIDGWLRLQSPAGRRHWPGHAKLISSSLLQALAMRMIADVFSCLLCIFWKLQNFEKLVGVSPFLARLWWLYFRLSFRVSVLPLPQNRETTPKLLFSEIKEFMISAS